MAAGLPSFVRIGLRLLSMLWLGMPRVAQTSTIALQGIAIVDFLPDRHYFRPDRNMLRDFSTSYPCGPIIRVSRPPGAV
jgi:hypothetical protein